MIRKFAVIGFCTLLVAGCGRDEAETAPQAAADSGGGQADAASALFERIDADTPWLMANVETMPEELAEKLWAPLSSMSELNRQTYTAVAEEMDEAPVVAALLREFAQIDSREAFEERGLQPNGHWAIHAVSMYPFMHWQLSDAEAFRATIERIASEGGAEPNWRSVEDAEILWIPMEELGLALSYDDNFATAAFVPDNAALLRRVANLDQPTTAYDIADLESFSDERGYTAYGSGFIDFGKVVDQLLDSDDALLAAARESTPLGEIAGNEVCRNELGALVNLFPRASLGYTDISETFMAFDMTLETEPSFAQRMQVIADTPVDLEKAEAGLLEFGLALNIVGARDFAREIVAGWVEAPPQCQLFDNIRENAEDWQLALNQPIPPVVTNFHGLRLNVEDVTMGENSQVESAEGSLALFMRNPQMMLGMAQMFSPELASLQLEPGGEPQPVPAGVIPNMPEGVSAWMGLGDAALGLAVGENQKDQLSETMDPGEGGDAILSYGINFENYGDILGGVLEDMQKKFEEMGEEPAMNNPSEAMSAMGEVYEYTRASMHLTERGIEFRSTMTLKD
ncbi:hypothetical protein [Wenzhouxiangella sediminis]|uniref:DUF3352 domain-containing protein n=1 Tax=Wenzhouxiangella sediminis TaxID=1792836 RepID=A0A3E1KA88_9GAMM|nr:hypothetical protein [Wenzhouxiangella sediminis]RFF31225.1 hypothetical protein DZC52_05255 [Wenzhouxiangella sediminis]